MKELEITTQTHDFGQRMSVIATFDSPYFLKSLATTLIEQIVLKIAERWVAENYCDIAKALDAGAIAQLAVARGAVEISNAIKETQAPQVLKEGCINIYLRNIEEESKG